MKFPYGYADFYKIITEDYLYIDRTGKIPLLEEFGDILLFLRPRRFGKTLLLSMLENYYDVNKAGEFERLFGHLEIGQKPTAKRNQYLILKWNFSVVDPQGEVKAIRQALHNHLNDSLKDFVKRYQNLLPYEVEFNPADALSSLASALSAAQATPYKVYLLIDEYDNFANEVFMAGQSDSRNRYETLIQSEGMLKTVFKAIKAGTEGRGLDRMFITGVSPVVMSDLTSGFNIAKSIYLEPEFNDLCGFWENEVADVLHQIGLECQLTPEQVTKALDLMRTFYNGYSFTYEAEVLIYNPTLTLYFIGHFQRHCSYPRRMLDGNLAMDRGKISYVSQLPHGEQVVTQALNRSHPLTIAELADRFGVKEMLKRSHDATFMVSLLYYFGVLALTGERTNFGDLILRIPNLVIEKLYVERIAELLLPDFTSKEAGQQAARIFYQTGDMQPLCDFIEQSQFSVFDNRDYKWANELTIKTTFLTLLFNDTFYIMDSETALQRDYADMTMIVRPDMRQFQLLDFLIEFKYVGLGENNLSGEQVKAMSVDDLQTLKPVQKALTESQTKLEGYRQTLQSAYGDRLRLRVYSVVAVGFDRLVWVEIEIPPLR